MGVEEKIRTLTRRIKAATAGTRFETALGALERRYRADQPRVPAGTPDGGQWTDVGGGAGMRVAVASERLQYLGKREGFGADRVIFHCYYGKEGIVLKTLEVDAMLGCPPFYEVEMK